MSIPKGLNDPGETPKQAAVREVFEETGLSLDPSMLIPLNSQKYPG
jgi:8-oxo-dGTP pyrophosphatase MutT (NUDIX family)